MNWMAGALRFLRKVFLVTAVIGLLGGAAWGVWHWRSGKERGARFRTEKVTRGRVAALINASGTVVPEDVVDVGAQVAGKIVEFGPDPDDSSKQKRMDYGSRVRAGDVLARIDDSLYKAEAGVAKADLDVALADATRARHALAASRATAQQVSLDLQRAKRAGQSMSPLQLDVLAQGYEVAKANVTALEAALDKAQKGVDRGEKLLEKARINLDYTIIRSPVDGVIIDRRVNIGQTVVASLNAPSLFLLAKDLRRMQVWASVNEADVGRLQPGQPANFKVDAFPDEVFSGTVAQVRLNASMTQNVVTYTVVVATDNQSLRLLPYLTANLQFRVAERNDVLLAPNAALRYRPAPERVSPDYLDEYLKTRQRRPVTTEMRAGKASKQSKATLWTEDEHGDLRPVGCGPG